MASIKTVADHAGVSIATVSRVLNGTKYVSPDIRSRVLGAIEALNYRPSISARHLAGQKTRSIGVLVPQLNDFFFSNLAFAIEKALSAQGYSPLFCSTENRLDKESDAINILISHGVDAVILVPCIPASESAGNVQRLTDEGIPVVLVDRGVTSLKVNQVLCSNFQGGYAGGQYLASLGHRHIGIVNSAADEVHSESGPRYERINGIRQALLEPKRKIKLEIVDGTMSTNTEVGYKDALNLLTAQPQLTAIFALSDAAAIGVYRAAAERNLRIPQDLSVMGFDDIPLAAQLVPRLTTVAQPITRIAQVAAELLFRQVQQPDNACETVMIDTQLVIRDSTAEPRARQKT